MGHLFKDFPLNGTAKVADQGKTIPPKATKEFEQHNYIDVATTKTGKENPKKHENAPISLSLLL